MPSSPIARSIQTPERNEAMLALAPEADSRIGLCAGFEPSIAPMPADLVAKAGITAARTNATR